MKNNQTIPTAVELKDLFDRVNQDILKAEKRKKISAEESESIPLSNHEYYAEQIYNLYFDDLVIEEDEAWNQAEALAKEIAAL